MPGEIIMLTPTFMADWGQYSRIEWFDANFHHHDGRAPLWCVRQTGTGFTNPYPRAGVPPPLEVDDFVF